MAATLPNGSVDIIKIINKGIPVRKWIRDSWARKKITEIQQRVAGIVVPTKTSELTNDSGFVTASAIPTETSDLVNDSGFITVLSVPSAYASNPLMDGTASAGSSTAWARGDHRHPTDTSRQAALSTAQLAAVNSGVTAEKVAEWDGITVPTKTSDLTNDSDFQTGTDVDDAISAEAGLMVPYGYCTIAAGTVAKTVTVSPAVTALTAGLCIAVKFQYANTATNPTLNVNGLGAKAIKRYGTTAAGTSAAANWNANSVVMLVYDGTYWMLADWNNTTYSGMTDAEYQAGTSTTNRLITPARLKAAIELHAPVQSVNGATGVVTVTVPTKTSDLTNDSGFITSVPVQSVNGQTGAVNLIASDVGALPSSTAIPSKTSDLANDSGYITASAIPSVPSASTTNPKMDGTASAGSSSAWSRGDHVHPHDTSKADKATTLAGYGITNAYTKTEVDGMIPTVPTSVSAFTNDAGYITASAVPDASTATPSMDGTGTAGSSSDYARADHVHPHDSSKQDALTTAQLAAVNSGITADDLAVNDASVLCPVTPIVPTLDAGTHHATYGGCWYYKIGHHVCVHIGVASITANTTTTLWQMPPGYIPYSGIAVNGQGSGYNNVSRARVTGTGAVIVNSTQAYATAYLEYDAFS